MCPVLESSKEEWKCQAGREEFLHKKSHILSEQNYDIKQLFKQLNIFIWENQQEIFSNMTQSLLLLSW